MGEEIYYVLVATAHAAHACAGLPKQIPQERACHSPDMTHQPQGAGGRARRDDCAMDCAAARCATPLAQTHKCNVRVCETVICNQQVGSLDLTPSLQYTVIAALSPSTYRPAPTPRIDIAPLHGRFWPSGLHSPNGNGQENIFAAGTAALRASPRFKKVADRRGLVQHLTSPPQAPLTVSRPAAGAAHGWYRRCMSDRAVRQHRAGAAPSSSHLYLHLGSEEQFIFISEGF
jgi:hypothetical protein